MQNYTIPDDAFSQELVRIRGLIGSGKLQDAALALNQAQHKAPRDARLPLLGMRLAMAAKPQDNPMPRASMLWNSSKTT